MMVRRCVLSFSVLAVVFLSGCMNLRPELYKPPASKAELDNVASAFYTGPVDGSLEEYRVYADKMAAFHQNKATELRQSNALLGELGFVSAVTAAVAGATEHIQTAKNALVVGAGASVVGDRYQMAVQAAAYEAVTKSFLCMRERLADAVALEKKRADRTLSAEFPDVGKQVRESSTNLVQKLQVKLRGMELPTPDLSKLKNALTQPADTAKVTAHDLLFSTNEDQTPITTLRANIQACEALFN